MMEFKMKKIGIVTICDDTNYGNRLQNYALQQVLCTMGFQPITIRNLPYNEWKYTLNRYHFLKSFEKLRNIDKKKKHLDAICLWEKKNHPDTERTANFNKFNKNINYTDFWLSEYNLKIDEADYFAFIAGSDQVFNYRYGRANRIDFLDFVKNAYKISYAASLGVDSIPISHFLKYKHYLKKFNAISVREESAKHYLSEMLPSKKIEVVCDPTILLDRKEWIQNLDKADVKLPDDYVVLMYLGDCSKLIEQRIARFSEEHNYKIVRLNDPRSGEYYKYGPYEFLYVISNAKMVFTDSFHTCVFSLIFHTSFYVTERIGDDTSIFSRLKCLLEHYGYEDRLFHGGVCEYIDENRFCVTDDRMKQDTEKSINYLRSALKID